MAGLFPKDYTKDTISVDPKRANATVGYKRSLKFDSQTGDFVRDGQNKIVSASGVEAWKQWCEKCFTTQRGAFRGYSTDFGIDYVRAFKASNNIEAEMILRKEITEAALADDYKRTKSVENITFNWISDDSVVVRVILIGYEGSTLDLVVNIGG